MANGTNEDLHTAMAVLAWLRPRCPRCGRLGVTPMTWYDAVIWFECGKCYKLWREDVSEFVASPEPVDGHDSTQPARQVA